MCCEKKLVAHFYIRFLKIYAIKMFPCSESSALCQDPLIAPWSGAIPAYNAGLAKANERRASRISVFDGFAMQCRSLHQ